MLKHNENILSFDIFDAHFWMLVGIKFINSFIWTPETIISSEYTYICLYVRVPVKTSRRPYDPSALLLNTEMYHTRFIYVHHRL